MRIVRTEMSYFDGWWLHIKIGWHFMIWMVVFQLGLPITVELLVSTFVRTALPIWAVTSAVILGLRIAEKIEWR